MLSQSLSSEAAVSRRESSLPSPYSLPAARVRGFGRVFVTRKIEQAMSEKITIDLDKFRSKLEPHVADWYSRIEGCVRECADPPSPPVESEDRRRLRVMREFFEACGIRVAPIQPNEMWVWLQNPDGIDCANRYLLRSDWLLSKHALRLAAAEASERGLSLRVFFGDIHGSDGHNWVEVYDRSGKEIGRSEPYPLPHNENEGAVAAVTRAILATKKDLPR